MSRSVFVPIRHLSMEDDEMAPDAVSVDLDALPSNALEVVDVLRAEAAPLGAWLQIAIEYYKLGMHEQFLCLLEEGSTPEIDKHYQQCTVERIGILNALAIFYTRHGIECRKKEQRMLDFEKATHYFKLADNIDIRESTTWIGKGLIFLAKSELQRADLQFSSLLQRNPKLIPALLGKAAVKFYNGDYKAALQHYLAVMEANPESPVYVRLGIALCAFQLRGYKVAKAAFQGVLDMDSNCVEARVGLAVLEMNSEKNRFDATRRALKHLEIAYNIDPTNPQVCNLLSSHFFFKGDNKASLLLAERAQGTSSKLLRADNEYRIARTYQCLGDFKAAAQHYEEATRLDQSNLIAHFGKAQMMMRDGDNQGAKLILEKVLEKYPDSFEVLRLLGVVFFRLGELSSAESLLKRAIALNGNDSHALLSLASLLVQSDRIMDLKLALSTYKQVVTIYTSEDEGSEPFELCSNIGVLSMRLNELSSAEEWLNRAQKKAQQALRPGEPLWKHPTIGFNQGVLLEKKGLLAEAVELYESLLQCHPDYRECYVRLAHLSRLRGNTEQAIAQLTTLQSEGGNNLDALILLGNIHYEQEDLKSSESVFKEVLKTNPNDSYALVAIASISLKLAVHFKAKDKSKYKAFISRAGKYFRQALLKNANNKFAAIGLGAVLAYHHFVKEAQTILNDVRESSRYIPEVWINLGHLYLQEGNFGEAIKMYETCVRRNSRNKDPEVLLFLARAHYLNGDMRNAKLILSKGLHLYPNNGLYWYNLALVSEHNAITVLQKLPIERTLHDVVTAVADLQNATRMFGVITKRHSELENLDESTINSASTHQKFSLGGIGKAQLHLDHALKQDAIRQQQARESKRLLEESERLERERAQKEVELRLAQEEQERKQLEQHQMRLAAILEDSNKRKRQKEEAEKEGAPDSKKKKSRKKAAEDEPDELSLSSNEEDVAQEIYNDNRNAKLRKIAGMKSGKLPPRKKLRRNRDAKDYTEGRSSDENEERPEDQRVSGDH